MERIRTKFRGTFIGGIFTLGSFLAIFTFIVPIISVMPGALIEGCAGNFVDNDPYSNVGHATLVALWILAAISILPFLLYVFFKARKGVPVRNAALIVFFILEFFIIHCLGFYCYWAIELDYRSDGQLIFAALSSFPYSSPFFVLLGMLIDLFIRAGHNKPKEIHL
jgi:hypothetical protein